MNRPTLLQALQRVERDCDLDVYPHGFGSVRYSDPLAERADHVAHELTHAIANSVPLGRGLSTRVATHLTNKRLPHNRDRARDFRSMLDREWDAGDLDEIKAHVVAQLVLRELGLGEPHRRMRIGSILACRVQVGRTTEEIAVEMDRLASTKECTDIATEIVVLLRRVS